MLAIFNIVIGLTLIIEFDWWFLGVLIIIGTIGIQMAERPWFQ